MVFALPRESERTFKGGRGEERHQVFKGVYYYCGIVYDRMKTVPRRRQVQYNTAWTIVTRQANKLS